LPANDREDAPLILLHINQGYPQALMLGNKQNSGSEVKHQALKNRAIFLLVEVTGMAWLYRAGDWRWLAPIASPKTQCSKGYWGGFRIHWMFTSSC